MNREKISETIEKINPKYIEEATEYQGKARNISKKVWYKWGAVAACLVLVLAVGFPFIKNLNGRDQSSTRTSFSIGKTAQTGEEQSIAAEPSQTASASQNDISKPSGQPETNHAIESSSANTSLSASAPVDRENVSFYLEGVAELSNDPIERTGAVIVRDYAALKEFDHFDAYMDYKYCVNGNWKNRYAYANAFDEAFFQNKALIVVFDVSSNSTYYARPTQIKTRGTKAIVTVTKNPSNGEYGMAQVTYLRYLISVDKEALEGITSVEVQKA